MGPSKLREEIVFSLFVLSSVFVFAAAQDQTKEEFQFSRDHVGVSFSPYVKNWEGENIMGWNSYAVSDIKIMLRLIHQRFARVATHAIGAQVIPGLPTRTPLADSRVSLAAAEMNRNENTTLRIIQGINTTHADRTVQAAEIFNVFNFTSIANRIAPQTVTELVFPEDVEILQILTENNNQSEWNLEGLKLGARIRNCSQRTDSLEQHANKLQFAMCSMFPDFSCNTTELAVKSVVDQYNTASTLLKLINPGLEVQIGETGWPTFGKDERLYNVANMKNFWEQIGAWAEKFNVVVYMHEAIDQPWRSDPRRTDPTDGTGRFGVWGHFGWWKRTDTYNNNPNTYLEKIIDLPKFADKEGSSGANTAVFITVPLISFLIIATLTWFLHRQKKRREAMLRLRLTEEEIEEFEKGSSDPAIANEPWNLPYQKEYEIPKEELDIHRNTVLGSGAFGIVYHGYVARHDGQREVAIKTIKTGGAAKELRNLLSEIKIMIYIGKHDNIVGLIGAQTADLKEGFVFLAAEFCGFGSLEKYLRKYPFVDGQTGEKSSMQASSSQYENVFIAEPASGYQNAPSGERISMSDLLNWSYEIANGMEYLGMKNVVHADLAARNILLTEDKKAKITDFGLSRKLYEYTQYVKKNQEPLPWRWMAIESLRNMTFSAQSDTWSYGVTLWEIFSLGGIPYPGLSWDVGFLEQLDNGLRMHKPKYADEEIYQQMLQTWSVSPSSRPSFASLKNFFLKKCFATVSPSSSA